MDPAPSSFRDRLAVDVTLTIGGTEYELAGGGVRHFSLELRSYGFTGVVELVVQDDKAHGGGFEDSLKDPFLGADLVEVSVSVAAVHDQPEVTQSPTPITCRGIATAKSVREVLYRRIPDQPLLVRYYRLEFADPARVLWTQHFPCQLYTDKTPQSIIDEHKGDKISLSYDWSTLTHSRPQWFLHLPVEYGASFYDFVVWLVDAGNAVFSYDYDKGQYAITATKAAASSPEALFGDDIETATLLPPIPPRHVVVVNNSYASAPRSETVTQDQSATAIRHDHMMRTTISQSVDDAVSAARTRLALGKYEAQLDFARMPTVGVMPGTAISLSAANRWNASSALVSPTWRVRELSIEGTMPQLPFDKDVQEASTIYTVRIGARLEQSDDPRVSLPAYRGPGYPGYVEGKVYSEKGEEGDKTFHTFKDETTSADEYTVTIPLWEDQKVKAPFIPYQGSGNVYVPSYREERVLVALWLERAELAKLLEWREGAALSMDVQGEQILLGKSGTSHTSLSHVYEDDQPVFDVSRKNSSDTSLIRMSEGTLLIQVQEQSEG